MPPPPGAPPAPGGFTSPPPGAPPSFTPPPPGAPGGFTPAAPYGQPLPSGNNGLAIAALVLGIVSLALTLLCGIGLLTGVPAIVLGVLALRKISEQPGLTGRGLAIGGIVTGAVGVVISLLLVLFLFFVG